MVYSKLGSDAPKAPAPVPAGAILGVQDATRDIVKYTILGVVVLALSQAVDIPKLYRGIRKGVRV